MSWRKFLVLVRGLSSASATVAAITVQHFIGEKPETVVAIATPEAAQSAFVGLFGARRRPG